MEKSVFNNTGITNTDGYGPGKSTVSLNRFALAFSKGAGTLSITPPSLLENSDYQEIKFPSGKSGTLVLDTDLNKASDTVDVTYLALTTLISTSKLLPNRYYRITDFQTVHNIPNAVGTVVNTGAIEPIIVRALSNNKLYTEATSEQYPQDKLLYEVNNTGHGIVGSTKGAILQRIDTKRNISMPYDWRSVKFRRYKFKPADYVSQGYNVSSVVISANKIYVCTKTHATAQPVTDGLYWKELLDDNTKHLAWSSSSWSIFAPGVAAVTPNIIIPVDANDFVDVVTFPNITSTVTGDDIFNVNYTYQASGVLPNIVFYTNGQSFAFCNTTILNEGTTLSANNTFISTGNFQMYNNEFRTLYNSLIFGNRVGAGSNVYSMSFNTLPLVNQSLINTVRFQYVVASHIESVIIGKDIQWLFGHIIKYAIVSNSVNTTFNRLSGALMSSNVTLLGVNFTGTIGLNATTTRRLWTIDNSLVNKTFVGGPFSDEDTPNALTQALTQNIIYSEAYPGIDIKEDRTNRRSTLTANNDTTYPTTKAVNDALDTKADLNGGNKFSSQNWFTRGIRISSALGDQISFLSPTTNSGSIILKRMSSDPYNLGINPDGNPYFGILRMPNLTTDRTYQFQDADGTVALTRDIGKMLTATASANGAFNSFTIPHGLAYTPTMVIVTPNSPDAMSNGSELNPFYAVLSGSNNVIISYKNPPQAGTDNLVWTILVK